MKDSYYGYRHPAIISPILSQNMVFSGNSVDGVVAFDQKTGQQKWRMTFKDGTEGLAVDSKTGLYFGTNNGQFYHVNASTGAILWSVSIGAEAVSAPLVQGEFVYYLAGNGALYCIEKETGRVLWVKSRTPKDVLTVRGTTSPVFFDGKVGVGYSDGFFVAYTAVDGSVAWEKQLGDSRKFNDVDAKPTLTEKCILLSNVGESLFCLDKANGTVLWRLDEGGSAHPAAIVGEAVYYSTENSVLKVDLKSGKLLKRFNQDKKWGQVSGVSAYKNWLVFGLSEGPVVLMDRETGDWVDQFHTGRGVSIMPTLTLKPAEIYVVSNQANVYKLKIVSNTR